jgi:hypothetical protein
VTIITTLREVAHGTGLRSEESRAQVETQGSHSETGEQTGTAKQRDQSEGMNLSPRSGSFAHKNVRNKRIHGNLLIEMAPC